MKIVDINNSRVDYSVKRVLLDKGEVMVHCPYCKNPVWRSRDMKNVVYCIKCKIKFELVESEVRE